MENSNNFFDTRAAFIQKFTASGFSYNPKTQTFVAEASDIAWPGFLKSFEIHNPKTGGFGRFDFVKADKDASGEDTYGWRYKSQCGINCLIIND